MAPGKQSLPNDMSQVIVKGSTWLTELTFWMGGFLHRSRKLEHMVNGWSIKFSSTSPRSCMRTSGTLNRLAQPTHILSSQTWLPRKQTRTRKQEVSSGKKILDLLAFVFPHSLTGPELCLTSGFISSMYPHTNFTSTTG